MCWHLEAIVKSKSVVYEDFSLGMGRCFKFKKAIHEIKRLYIIIYYLWLTHMKALILKLL